ncbi:hypothetical protein MYX04_04545 [Nitrospiraceae bacterium AH_259_D15_M11_P09]|nr:hypothetical protein [Nitrospiraceae bacterium AH_259_D15_M11_P09]
MTHENYCAWLSLVNFAKALLASGLLGYSFTTCFSADTARVESFRAKCA